MKEGWRTKSKNNGQSRTNSRRLGKAKKVYKYLHAKVKQGVSGAGGTGAELDPETTKKKDYRKQLKGGDRRWDSLRRGGSPQMQNQNEKIPERTVAKRGSCKGNKVRPNKKNFGLALNEREKND